MGRWQKSASNNMMLGTRPMGAYRWGALTPKSVYKGSNGKHFRDCDPDGLYHKHLVLSIAQKQSYPIYEQTKSPVF